MKIKLLVLLAAIVLAAALPLVAFADSGKVRFSAEAPVGYVGLTQLANPALPPTDTSATFRASKDGKIRLVTVDTVNELVVAPVTTPPDCSAPADPFCGVGPQGLVGSVITSLHSSKAILVNPQYVTPGPGPYPDALAGALVGKLDSNFSITKPDGSGNTIGAMTGSARLLIRGSGAYVCVVSLDPTNPYFLAPLSVKDCQAGTGKLVPLSLDVTDSGKFEIESTAGVFGDIEEVEGQIQVQASASLAGVTGQVSISHAKLER